MKKQLTKIISGLILITIVFFAVSLPAIVLAQDNNDYKLLAPIPGFGEKYVAGDMGKYVKAIIELSIVIAAVLAVVMITIGGFKYMTSESMQLKSEGKDNIKNAFLGLVILASSYLILSTINPALLNFNLNIQGISVPGNPIPSTETRPETRPATGDTSTVNVDPSKTYNLVFPPSESSRNREGLSASDCKLEAQRQRRLGTGANCVEQ